MENFIKRTGIWMVCLCLIIGCIWKTEYAYAKEDTERAQTEVTLEIVIGYDGNQVRYCRENRAIVTVNNTSLEPIDGVLKLYLPAGTEDCVTVIEREVYVEAKEKAEVDLSFRSSDIFHNVTVSLEDRKGKNIARKETVVNKVSSRTLVYGILGKDSDSLTYFSKENYGRDIVFEEKEFPDRKEWLEIVDVLVIGDCELWKLSKEQQVALTDWVKDGGTVVIGNNGKQSIRNLDIFGIKAKESKDELMVTRVSGTYYKRADVTMYPVVEGRGAYVVCSKSLKFSNTDLVKKNACVAASKKYYGETAERFLYSDYSDEGYCGNSSSPVEKKRFPLIWRIVVLLVVYVLLITVVLRLILKRKDRLEYMWGIIPVAAFAFMGIVYIIGIRSRVTDVQMSYHTVVEYEKNGDVGKATSCISIVNPSNQTYEVNIPDGMSVWNADAYEEMFTFMGKDIRKEVKISKEKVIFEGNASFERNNLNGKYEVEKTGDYDSSITCKNYEYKGTFTNHMGVTMKNACFVAGKRVYQVGDIKDGETVKISEDKKNAMLYNAQDLYERIQSRKWLSFGKNERKYDTDYGYLAAIYNYLNSYSCAQRIMEPKMIYVTEEDSNIKSQWGVEDIVGYTVNVLNVDVDYTQGEDTFVCDLLCSKYADQLCSYVDNDRSSDAIVTCQLGENEQLTSLKYLEKPNDLGKDKTVLKKEMHYSQFDGTIELYNYRTAVFETVLVQPGQELTEKELVPYIGEDNQIKIRLEINSENSSEEEYILEYAPVLSATVKEAK